MNITFLESGSDATQDLSFWTSTSGTVASATDQSYTGGRSIKGSTGNPAVPAIVISKGGILSDAGSRISFRVRYSAWTAGVDVFRVYDSSNAQVFTIVRDTATGVLKSGTILGSTALSANTWYRISVAYTITNTSTFRIKVYLNGVLEIDRTTTALPRVNSDRFAIVTGSGLGTNQNGWFDDFYVDDVSDYSDTGDIRVTAKRPYSNGTTNDFSTQIGSGNSGYGSGHADEVNEQPLSTTNGWSMVGAGSAVTEEYNVEEGNLGDVNTANVFVIGCMGWLYASSAVSETGQIIVNGETSNIALTSTNTLFLAPSTPGLRPQHAGEDIGIITDTTLTTVSLYEAGILIAYLQEPSTATMMSIGM